MRPLAAAAALGFAALAAGDADVSFCHVQPYDQPWETAVLTHRLDRGLKAVEAARAQLAADYGEWHERLFDVCLDRWGEKDDKDALAFLTRGAALRLRKALLRAMIKREKFVIAFGGHSAAVAHGNYFEESSAHVLGRLLCPVLGELRVPVVVRNQAMGAHGGCPSCVNVANHYGADADMVMWDFGMTDHSEETRDLFVRQALLLPKQPVVLVHYNTKNERKGFLNHLMELHKAGFGVGGASAWRLWDYSSERRFPPPDANPESMPYWLRGLQGYPGHQNKGTGTERYNATITTPSVCGNRKTGAAKWHPGFKEHHLVGSILGKMLLDVVEDAMNEYNAWVFQNGDEPMDEEDFTFIPRATEDDGGADLSRRASLDLPAGGCGGNPLCNLPFQGRSCLSPHAPHAQHWQIRELMVSEAELQGPLKTRYAGQMLSPDEDLAACHFPGPDNGGGHVRLTYPPEEQCTHHIDRKGYVQLDTRWLVLRLPVLTRDARANIAREAGLDEAHPMVKHYIETDRNSGRVKAVLCELKDLGAIEVEVHGEATVLEPTLFSVCANVRMGDQEAEKGAARKDYIIAMRHKEGEGRPPRLSTIGWVS